jgi:hypothetical protein
MRRFIAAGSVLFVCGLLAGCAPAANGPTASPAAPAPSVSPAATPTPTPVAAPRIRVPLSCANVFTTSAVGALLGTTVKLAVDENTPPSDLDSIAQVQRGILTCTWGGKDKTDNGFDQALSVYVEPDATGDFTTNFSAVKNNFGKPVLGTYGDQSAYGCVAHGGLACGANVLVGSYWLTVDLHDLDAANSVPKPKAVSRLKTVLDTTVKALHGAGAASPAWVAPAGGLLPFCAQSGNTTIVRKAFASKGLDAVSADPESGTDVSTIGEQGDSFAHCDWNQNVTDTNQNQETDVEVSILDGGIWSLPQLVADPPTEFYVGDYKPVSISGAQGAVLACNTADCDAIVGVGTNAVEIGFSDIGAKRDMASLTALVDAITAA